MKWPALAAALLVCGCTREPQAKLVELFPNATEVRIFSNLNWDRKALTRIVEAHHLPPIPKKE